MATLAGLGRSPKEMKCGVTKTNTTIKPTMTSYCQLARGYSHSRQRFRTFMPSVSQGLTAASRNISNPQVLIHRSRCLAAFSDSPHHQRLAAPHIARREYAGQGRLPILLVRLDVSAPVDRDAKLLHQTGFHWPGEAHSQQHQVHVERQYSAWGRLKIVHAHSVKLLHISLGVASEVRGGNGPLALPALFM